MTRDRDMDPDAGRDPHDERDLRDEREEGLDEGALRALRAAFHALPAPPPARPLAAEDVTTRATVAWMASAFAALPVPEARVPVAPVASLADARSGRRARVAAAAAVAAALLVALGAAWWWSARDHRELAPPAPVARGPDAPDADVAPVAPDAPVAHADPPALLPDVARAVDARPDRLELTSGPVRLILFTQAPSSIEETPR